MLIRCVINGTTAVVHERFDAERVKSTLEAGEVTLASLVPTMLARLRDAGLERAPGLRAIALGGGPVPADLLDWAAEHGHPGHADLRHDRDVLAGRCRRRAPGGRCPASSCR